MATILWKAGESRMVNGGAAVKRLMEAGWSPDDPNAPKPDEPKTLLPPDMAGMSVEDAKQAMLKEMGIVKDAPKRRGRPPKVK
jgi:hypothetical protein